MPDKPPLDENSVAVQKHLDIMQCVINRMANTSRALKTWCITIVAAIFVVVAKTDLPGSAVLIALVPTIMFFGMDAYYLGMEKGFRDSYDDFVEKFHNEKLSVNDLYVVEIKGRKLCLFWMAAKSPSVWVFYLVPIIAGIAFLLFGEYAHNPIIPAKTGMTN